jgi:hypothetical protein
MRSESRGYKDHVEETTIMNLYRVQIKLMSGSPIFDQHFYAESMEEMLEYVKRWYIIYIRTWRHLTKLPFVEFKVEDVIVDNENQSIRMFDGEERKIAIDQIFPIAANPGDVSLH